MRCTTTLIIEMMIDVTFWYSQIEMSKMNFPAKIEQIIAATNIRYIY